MVGCSPSYSNRGCAAGGDTCYVDESVVERLTPDFAKSIALVHAIDVNLPPLGEIAALDCYQWRDHLLVVGDVGMGVDGRRC